MILGKREPETLVARCREEQELRETGRQDICLAIAAYARAQFADAGMVYSEMFSMAVLSSLREAGETLIESAHDPAVSDELWHRCVDIKNLHEVGHLNGDPQLHRYARETFAHIPEGFAVKLALAETATLRDAAAYVIAREPAPDVAEVLEQ